MRAKIDYLKYSLFNLTEFIINLTGTETFQVELIEL